jgi:hypothetical protein
MNTTAVGARSVDLSRLEVVKWIAFAAMVVDHVGVALLDRSVAWLHLVGGFAFPVFCFCYGLGLARTSDPLQVASRLIVPGALAQAAWFWIEPSHPVNVLGMFGLCAVAVRLPWFAAVVLGLAAVVGEGGLFLPLLVAAGFAAARWGSRVPLVVSGVAWAVLAHSPGALVATAAVARWPERWAVAVPRVPGLLAWGYAAHLALLAALKGALS